MRRRDFESEWALVKLVLTAILAGLALIAIVVVLLRG